MTRKSKMFEIFHLTFVYLQYACTYSLYSTQTFNSHLFYLSFVSDTFNDFSFVNIQCVLVQCRRKYWELLYICICVKRVAAALLIRIPTPNQPVWGQIRDNPVITNNQGQRATTPIKCK